jgi:hypothetical protein
LLARESLASSQGAQMSGQPPYGYEPYGQQPGYPGVGGAGDGSQTYPPTQMYPPPPQYAAPMSSPMYPPPPPQYPSGAYPPAGQPMPPMYQPMYVPVAAPSAPGSGLAVAALVCGIVGLVVAVFTFCGGFFISGPLGVIAVIMGALGRKSYTHQGQATAGLVMGIITLVLTLGLYLIVYAFLRSVSTLPGYLPTATPAY